ncbi:MAG: NAD(P)H-dependent oxidoreductase [Polyangiales bacterium]
MKPDDRNGARPPAERPFRVLVIAGSDRRQYDCPGVDSKARALALRVARAMPDDWEVDLEDLANITFRARIQSCNACVSTSMALCVWPCNCYERGSRLEPDLMWDLDLYARLDLADAWVIVGPVNWYAPSSNLKLMFDRLVCMNGGNPREDLIGHKDPERAMALERSPAWEALSRNHLEGRTAAFFCYGDGGGDELDDEGRPKALRHPAWFDPAREPFDDMRDAYAPLAWQCRYSGVEVPDALWRYVEFGRGEPYSANQAEHLVARPAVLDAVDDFSAAVVDHVRAKGKVTPGPYRAYGYEPPGHLLADLKTGARNLRLRLGLAPKGSSPAAQQRLGLNDDEQLLPERGEVRRSRTD